MHPDLEPLPRYCLLALDRLADDPTTKPPGFCQASNLRTILAQASSHRDLGRRFVIWDRTLSIAVNPSGLY